jgi:hypothetical protein
VALADTRHAAFKAIRKAKVAIVKSKKLIIQARNNEARQDEARDAILNANALTHLAHRAIRKHNAIKQKLQSYKQHQAEDEDTLKFYKEKKEE